MRYRLFAFEIVLILSLGTTSALAQDKAPLRLTLKQAVDLALKQNPEVQIAVLNLAESKQERTIARSGLLPQADLRVSESAIRENIEALFGKPFPGIPEHIGPFAMFQAGPGFSFPILDLTAFRRWQSASHEAQASGHDSEAVREQTVLLVVSQYLGGLQAATNVTAAQSRVQLAQALYDQANDL